MTTFGSTRAALAYMFSCRRGPKMARPRWSDAPNSTGRTPWDAPMIGSLLYGPWSEGMCGVDPGSELDDELQEWALEHDRPMSDRVARVIGRLRRLMLEHGFAEQNEPTQFSRWTDPEGRTWLSIKRA